MRTNKPDWPDIALIGSYPPPYGGISVHLQRLTTYMEAMGLDFKLFNTVTPSERLPWVKSVLQHKTVWFLKFCLMHHCRVVHLQSINWLSRLMLGLTAVSRGGKYILSIHGRSISESLNSQSRIKGWLTCWLLRRMDVVIACNKDIERECIGIAGVNREKVHMIPAFMKSDLENISEAPDYVREFMHSHTPMLFAVGWVGQSYCGEDLYGIDMLMELMDRLKGNYKHIGLVLSMNGGEQAEIFKVIRESESRVGKRILFITESLDDVSGIFKTCDLFLRPTNTDGDAVSIREALHVGTPVVASDAVPRPAPCLLFRNRDMDDFEDKVKKALLDLSRLRENVRSYEMPDNAAKIIQIYKELTEESNNDLGK